MGCLNSMTPKLKSLTIKPTSTCSNACSYCNDRRELLRKGADKKVLSLVEWQEVVQQAKYLGAQHIAISGGEPTLYPHLSDLVGLCKEHLKTTINSNGFNVTRDWAREMSMLGLDSISISLVSLIPEKHDTLRGRKGSHSMAIAAIRNCIEHGIFTTVHIIVNRNNYREIPDLIDFLCSERVNAFVLVLPENDHQIRSLLMTREQIDHFRDIVINTAAYNFELACKYNIEERLRKFIEEPDDCDYSIGIYRPNGLPCSIPSSFLLVYPDGSVLPCNSIEYTHFPIIGNVRESTLKEIWFNEAYQSFRKEGYYFCKYCPMNLQLYHRICYDAV